jgi:N-methylhydantoinase A
VIRSDGGVAGTAQAKRQAESTILSGPAAGVKGSQAIGEAVGSSNVIGMDMGGTSTDVSLIEDDEPLVTTEYEVKFDIPLVRPMLDVTTIGSGGGSVAWIDDGGSLRVGPQSAGADPGPVCYNLGGTQPTITDAHLVLGRLDPKSFLGGKRQLNSEKAHEAMQDLADELDMSVLEAAEGILEIANENMAAAVRETTIERGQDPRDYTLVGFGGCGPMHAAEVAGSLDVPSVVIPSASGVLSAVGGAMMDVQQNVDRTFYVPAGSTEPDELQAQFEELEDEVRSLLAEENPQAENIHIDRVAEMRYLGQTYEVDVPVSSGSLDEDGINDLTAHFHQFHEQEYGVASDEFPVTFVNLRVTGRMQSGDQDFQSSTVKGESSDAGETREVYFDGRWHETALYHRSALGTGINLEGPAILNSAHSTVTLPPESTASVDEYGNIKITTNGGS